MIWDTIAADRDISAVSGVRMKHSIFFFPRAIEDDLAQLAKLRELERSGV